MESLPDAAFFLLMRYLLEHFSRCCILWEGGSLTTNTEMAKA